MHGWPTCHQQLVCRYLVAVRVERGAFLFEVASVSSVFDLSVGVVVTAVTDKSGRTRVTAEWIGGKMEGRIAQQFLSTRSGNNTFTLFGELCVCCC